MSNKILTVVVLIACVLIGAVSMQLVSGRAEGQDFRSGSRRTRGTQTTVAANQAMDNTNQNATSELATVPSAQRVNDNEEKEPLLMEIVDPVQRYQSQLIDLTATDTLMLVITDTQSGVVRLREIRRQTTWQEFSFADYGFRR